MTREKWEYIIGDVEDKFGLLEKGRESFVEEGGVNVDYVVFNSPAGKIRLEYIEKPVVLGKKTQYSHRAGTTAEIDYVYSETEKTATFVAYKWSTDNDDWSEIEAEKMFL
ncbi:MAG: hypothetical protein WC415_04735 [Patescibacteria group bacterium]|jgi:hypothetical protein